MNFISEITPKICESHSYILELAGLKLAMKNLLENLKPDTKS